VRGAMSARLRRATLLLLQLDEAQLFPESLTLGRPTDGIPTASTAAGAGGGGGEVFDTLEVSLSKGVTGLGLDLVPLAHGAVVLTIVRPYDFNGGPVGKHPADAASPPLLVSGFRHFSSDTAQSRALVVHRNDLTATAPSDPLSGLTPLPRYSNLIQQDGDELTQVNGVSFSGDFERCKKSIREASTNLTVTVRRKRAAGAAGVELVGGHVGDWNVATGDASLFISAHFIDNRSSPDAGHGLLLVVMRVAEGWRFSLSVPPAALKQVTSAHFGASLLARSKALQLAKVLANLLEQRPAVGAAEQGPQYVLKAPDRGAVFAWSAPCEPSDSIQVRSGVRAAK